MVVEITLQEAHLHNMEEEAAEAAEANLRYHEHRWVVVVDHLRARMARVEAVVVDIMTTQEIISDHGIISKEVALQCSS